ncbi:MAG: hypothetical protein IT210_14895 [Armatimonadetes bacterium]|nr:hypothetical protein [Armatimonadota bacterium]
MIYFKGAYVLHSLRSVVGDKAFFRILRAAASRHAHGKLDIETYVALSKEVSGRPLNDFFDAWLRRSGAMRLSYGYTASPGGVGATQVRLTIRQEGTVYSVPLQAALTTDRGRYIETVQFQGSRQTLTLEVPGAVSSVDIDPEEQ